MKKIEEAKKQWEKLPDRVRAILIGTIYGDSSVGITKGYANARVQFRHSINQTEYFNWKRDILRQEISVDRTNNEKNKDTMLQEVKNKKEYGKAKWRYQSQVLPSLTYLHELTHEGGVKTVKRSTLNKMTALSLAVWWLDDGSLVARGRQGVICTDGFTEKEVKIIEQYLKVGWEIGVKSFLVREQGQPKLKKDGTERWRIRFETIEELEKFLKIIMPYVEVKTMMRKILIRYTDAERQQRWTSEIVERTKFTRKEVEDEIAKAKTEDDIVHSKSK